MNTTTTTSRNRQSLASTALFREAFQCFADASTTLLDALYTFFVLDAPAWINRQDDRFCALLFADEPWELRPSINTPKPSDNQSWWRRIKQRWAKRKHLIWHSVKPNVYDKPFEVPCHVHKEPNHPAWDVLWLTPGVAGGTMLYLFCPELLIGIMVGSAVVLALLALRKE